MTEQEMLNTLLDRICRLEVLYRRASDELMDLQSANDRLEGKYCNLLRALGLSAMSSVDEVMARIEGLEREKDQQIRDAVNSKLQEAMYGVRVVTGNSGVDVKIADQIIKRIDNLLIRPFTAPPSYKAPSEKIAQFVQAGRITPLPFPDEVGEVKEVRE